MATKTTPDHTRPVIVTGDERSVLRRTSLLSRCDDARKPLWALKAGLDLFSRSERLSTHERQLVGRMLRHANRADESLRSLLDDAVATAGTGIPLERTRCRIAAVVLETIAAAREASPTRPVRHDRPEGVAEWDRGRVVQALCNVFGHLDEYGVPGAPTYLSVTVSGRTASFVATVMPAVRGADELHARLAIAQDIAHAHGGSLDSSHDASGRFSVSLRLPLNGRPPEQST